MSRQYTGAELLNTVEERARALNYRVEAKIIHETGGGVRLDVKSKNFRVQCPFWVRLRRASARNQEATYVVVSCHPALTEYL